MPVTRICVRTQAGSPEPLEIWLFIPTSQDARFDPNAGSQPWPRAEGRWGNAKHLGTSDCDEEGITTLWDDDEVMALSLRVGDQLRIGMPATLERNGGRASYAVEVTELEVL